MLALQMHLEHDSLSRQLDSLIKAYEPTAIAAFMKATIEPYLQERAERRFAMEGDDASGPWAPLSNTTQEFRSSQGFSPDHPINRRTDELYLYITGTPAGVQPTSTGGAILTFPGTPPTGELASKVRTAQEGKAAPATVPRPVIAVNEADVAFATMTLEAYIVAAGQGF